MEQAEGTHQLISSRTVGHISSEIVEISRGAETNTMPEQELSVTPSVKKRCFACVTPSVKKRCFACHDTSHNLEQCGTKYKHTTVAHQFGYATKYPFTMIQPSEETVQKEKFYHHCVLITSNLSNLDQGLLKSELLKYWKLSGDWELRRDCNKSFLASFSSEDDMISCLRYPNLETLLDDKEINLTITRWKASDDGSLDLVEDWLLVSGVPKIYRNWMDLYQVASAFGVLTDVVEESLEVGDTDPIRLKIASRSFDGAPFSYNFTFGWSSKLVMLTAIQDKETEGLKHKNKEISYEHEKEPEGVQTICPTPRIMIGEQHLRGIQKPPIKHVYERRNKKQQVTQSINKTPSDKMDKDVAPHCNSNATRTEASTGCDMLEKDCTKIVLQRELNMEEITPARENKKAERLGACRDTEYNNVAAPTINLKKTQILGDTSRTPRDELITKHTKGVRKDKMGSGVQVRKKEDASKKYTRLLPSSEEVGIYESFSEMGLQENLLKGIYHYGLEKPSAVHKRGIVPLCKGFGVIHQSFSGTTETICTGVLQRLDYGRSSECQALILVPTPELAQETTKVIGALGQFLGVTAQTYTGGTSARADQQTLSSRVQVVIGTPDCILDMLERHALCIDHIRMLFLDEADELFTGGFKEQVNYVILHLRKKIQVGLFSATYSNEAIETSLIMRFMDKPVEVTVPREEELKTVKQYYLEVENEELKQEKLYALLKATGVERLVIFVNTKAKARSLAKDVSKHYAAVSISHDGMNQHARNKAMQNLESGSSKILISTDHRGTIGMPEIPMIINYDVPTESMQYVRRLQQQNRQFRKPQSVAINLVTPADLRTLAPITKFCNCSIGALPSDIK